MTGSNKFFLLSRRLFEGKQRSRRAHTRIAGLRLALTRRSTPFFLGRTSNQCNSQPWELNFTWQAEGSVSSLSSASSAKPQSRCALETRCRSSTDIDPAASPAAHLHLITADHSASGHVRAHRASHHQSTCRAVSGSYIQDACGPTNTH